LSLRPSRLLLERYVGLDRRRALPRFRRRFSLGFAKRADRPVASRKVALFVDCFTEHFEPEVLWDAVRVLEGLGFEVQLAGNGCCGRAALSQGLIEEACAKAEHNAQILSPLLEEGLKVVGVEPSCIAALREDYRYLLSAGAPLREGVFEVMEYLAYLKREGRLDWEQIKSAKSLKIVYHGHCQQKAMGADAEIFELLKGIPALEVEVVEVSCCGMAGSFGYKREFYELSRHLGRRLASKIKSFAGEPVASGFSCRSQIRDELGIRVRHPIQIIAELLGGGHGI
jgi:Fe-S oxidoreductase